MERLTHYSINIRNSDPTQDNVMVRTIMTSEGGLQSTALDASTDTRSQFHILSALHHNFDRVQKLIENWVYPFLSWQI